MKTKCPKTGCGQIYPIPEEAAGKKVRCKKCDTVFFAHPWTPPKPKPKPKPRPAPEPAPAPAEAPEQTKDGSENVKASHLVLVALVFILAILYGAYSGGDDDPKPKPKPAVAKKAPEKPRKPVAAVQNSAWDGSVYQVEDYLEDHLKDPDSVQYIEWSAVVKIGSGYVVRCKYRAKNSFGGYVLAHQYFRMDKKGNVVAVSEVN